MENMAMNNVAMAALLNETLPALASPTDRGTSSMIRVIILSILGIGGLALLILSCCCESFREFRRRPQSRASYSGYMEENDRRPQSRATLGSYSVCLEEDDNRSQSLATRGTYSESGSAMGSILLVMVLLAALTALVVGAVKLLVWLVHLCGTIHVPGHVPMWLADFWDSATAWVILAWNSATAWVIHAWNSMEMPVLLVVGISLALLILLYFGLWVFGFMDDDGVAFGSCAAMWQSSIGDVVAGSLYSILQTIAAGGISVFLVLLYIVPCVLLVVGAFEIIVWLVHSGTIHVPTWLVDSWDSSAAWVLHAWDSVEILGWWHSFVAWLHNLWESITDHHKWKIYT